MCWASGTGIQELCSQIALAGEGITHAIGLGGRDLSAEVGISALTALEMLGADDKSRVGFCVETAGGGCSPAYRERDEGHRQTRGSSVLGYTSAVARDENVWFAATLDDAARLACLLARVAARRSSLSTTGDGVIRGLYTGGTLAAEAAGLLASHLNVAADAQHHHGMMLDAAGHQIIDLGMILHRRAAASDD